MRVPYKAILIGGFFGGLFDLIFAVCFAASRHVPSLKLFQTIASGVFGKAAYDGGTATAICGIALHFALSLVWASIFAIAFRNARASSPYVLGALFGAVVFFVMRLVVLPLSAYPNPVAFNMPGALYDLLSHMFLFGTPIALASRKFSVRNR